jgi:hypothetical protein
LARYWPSIRKTAFTLKAIRIALGLTPITRSCRKSGRKASSGI